MELGVDRRLVADRASRRLEMMSALSPVLTDRAGYYGDTERATTCPLDRLG